MMAVVSTAVAGMLVIWLERAFAPVHYAAKMTVRRNKAGRRWTGSR